MVMQAHSLDNDYNKKEEIVSMKDKAHQNTIEAATVLLALHHPTLTPQALSKALANAMREGDEVKSLEPMLTKKDTCRYLQLSLMTVNRMIKRGELPSVKFKGGSVRIPAKPVMDMVRGEV